MMKSLIALAILGLSNGVSAQPLDTLIKVTNIETSYPSWSPDGTELVFQSNRMDDNSEIYRSGTDGSGIRRLTNNPGLDEYPVFSPDGDQIFFVSQKDGNQEIYSMDAMGQDQKNLTNHPARDIHPQVSPDGKRILFNSNRAGNFDLYALDLSADQLLQLTDSPEDDTYAHWSPDGEKIVFVRWLNEGGKTNGEIFLLDLSSESEKRLTNHAAFDGWPSWSDDGEKIVFASSRHNRKDYQVYLMNIDGSEVTKITSGEAEDASFTKPVFARDGSGRVACTRTKDGNVEVFIFTLNTF